MKVTQEKANNIKFGNNKLDEDEEFIEMQENSNNKLNRS